MGFTSEHRAIKQGAEYLFSEQLQDGSWALGQHEIEGNESSPYSMIPLQTAFPLRGLAACGYAVDARAEKAYAWLLDKRLPDGAWSTGIASGSMRRVGAYRRLAHSRWGCRCNTTAALICLALHPQRKDSDEARRALDLLLGRETREQHALGFEVARLLGYEASRGFLTYFARFDLALILDFCARVGATKDDERVAALVAFIESLQGAYGMWEYQDNPQVSRWLTLDILRSLAKVDNATDWLSLEPRTPFSAYAKKPKRY
jgi:hypothetical protein